MAGSTQPKHCLEGKKIVVAGAGISGLAFAISLHRLWPGISSSPVPSLVLYERDPCAVPPNREGYSLSLRSDHPSAGIQTLIKMGLLGRIVDVAIADLGHEEEKAGEEGGFCVWDGQNENWGLVMKIRSKTPANCPVAGLRIARGALRRILTEAVERLPSVEIKWDTAIAGIATSDSGDVQITTSKGENITADILIAADGSSSKLRSILRPEDGLKFAGPTCLYGTTSLKYSPTGKSDEFGTVISGKGPALFVAPVDCQSMIWCLSWHVETPHQPRKQPMSLEASEELMKEARRIGEPAYGDRFIKILEATDPQTMNKFNAMDKQSFAHNSHIQNAQLRGLQGNIIFLGDANHAVSPFAGNGANLALMDGWDLAESLALCSSLPDAVAKYDRLAVNRARQVVRISHLSIRIMHSKGWMLWFWIAFLRVVRWLFFK